MQRCRSFRYVGQNLICTLIADTAGIAFAAAFVLEEIQQDFGQIDHTSIFITDEQGT